MSTKEKIIHNISEIKKSGCIKRDFRFRTKGKNKFQFLRKRDRFYELCRYA